MNADDFPPSVRPMDSTGVHIVRGFPDDEEVAALVAGLAAYGALSAEEVDLPADHGDSRWVRGGASPWNPHAVPDSWQWSGRG